MLTLMTSAKSPPHPFTPSWAPAVTRANTIAAVFLAYNNTTAFAYNNTSAAVSSA